MIRDSARNLYGTTSQGGAGNYGGVVLFTVDTAGHETVLHRFEHDSFPHSGVILDSAGNLYGTTLFSGVIRDPAGNLYGTANYGGSTIRTLGLFTRWIRQVRRLYSTGFREEPTARTRSEV